MSKLLRPAYSFCSSEIRKFKGAQTKHRILLLAENARPE